MTRRRGTGRSSRPCACSEHRSTIPKSQVPAPLSLLSTVGLSGPPKCDQGDMDQQTRAPRPPQRQSAIGSPPSFYGGGLDFPWWSVCRAIPLKIYFGANFLSHSSKSLLALRAGEKRSLTWNSSRGDRSPGSEVRLRLDKGERNGKASRSQ